MQCGAEQVTIREHQDENDVVWMSLPGPRTQQVRVQDGAGRRRRVD
jgi:hypothetical protein